MNKFVDERGEIINILDAPIMSVALIKSNANASRANHWHKQYGHWCFLTAGKLNYFERPCGEKTPPSKRLILPGELWWTPPLAEHKMVFLENSEMWCFGQGERDQENYENDTVRMDYELDTL